MQDEPKKDAWITADNEDEWKRIHQSIMVSIRPQQRTSLQSKLQVQILIVFVIISAFASVSAHTYFLNTPEAQVPEQVEFPATVEILPETFTTTHFRYQFYERDRKTVIAVAPMMESYYEDARQWSTAFPEDIQLSIIIDAESSVSTFIGLSTGNRSLVVSSPAVYKDNDSMTDVDLLAQSLTFWFSQYSLKQFFVSYPQESQNPHQGMLYDALELWLIWRVPTPLSKSKADIVKWLYNDSGVNPGQRRRHLPQGYETLCEIFQLYHFVPMDLSIPLLCNHADRNRMSTEFIPQQLNRITSPSSDLIQLEYQTSLNFNRVIALVTVLDYIVDTYDSEHISIFIQNFNEYPTWTLIIEETFGVSQQAFEKGWLDYLAEIYP